MNELINSFKKNWKLYLLYITIPNFTFIFINIFVLILIKNLLIKYFIFILILAILFYYSSYYTHKIIVLDKLNKLFRNKKKNKEKIINLNNELIYFKDKIVLYFIYFLSYLIISMLIYGITSFVNYSIKIMLFIFYLLLPFLATKTFLNDFYLNKYFIINLIFAIILTFYNNFFIIFYPIYLTIILPINFMITLNKKYKL